MPLNAPPRKILHLGWDAADWKLLTPLIEAGEMPHLASLIREGCMGRISTIRPIYSPMLWTSIATGKRPYKHGVLGFSEPLPDGSGVRPVSGLSRRTKAYWNIFNQLGWRGHVVGWWPSHPAEPINGVMISNLCHQAVAGLDEPWPVPAGGMHPPELMEILANLRVHPGELDEEMIDAFIPGGREIDQAKDSRLGACLKVLAESATVQNWAMHLAGETEWDFLSVYFDGLDHFSHAFMPYHPPRQSHISERDFGLFSGVMTTAAKFHDLMLGALLAKMPDDITVILNSDHGFAQDRLRLKTTPLFPAGPSSEHSDFGILVMKGPGIRKGAVLQGAGILDITPTLLTLLDLPVGEDMDGRPLLDAFENPPPVRSIASWDGVPGDDGRHAAEAAPDPAAETTALRQLIAMGYIQPLPGNVEQAVRETSRELEINLAEALIDGGREAEALPILRRLHEDWPEEWRFALRRAMCCRVLGRIGEMRAVVADLQENKRPPAEAARREFRQLMEDIRKRQPPTAHGALQPNIPEPAAVGATPPDSVSLVSKEEQSRMEELRRKGALNTSGLDYLRAVLALCDNRPARALELLESARQGLQNRPGLHLQIGETYQRMGKWLDAQEAFHHVLAADPDNAHAYAGLARSYLGMRQWKLAAAAAQKALGLVHAYPLARFLLGIAYFRLGLTKEAVAAWEQTVELHPGFWPAQFRLARHFRQQGEDSKADACLAQARHHRQKAIARAAGLESLSSLPESPARPAAMEPEGSEQSEPWTSLPPEIFGDPSEPFGEDAVTLVTGLPRSGTSLLMQMLAAGGLDPLTDGNRAADEDNPQGYFELEAVKSLREDSTALRHAGGRAVKVVLPLLPHIPAGQKYHVLLIERDLDEVFASQRTMIERQGGKANDPALLRPAYERLLSHSRRFLTETPSIRTLRLGHRWILRNPGEAAAAISQFLGRKLRTEKMAAAVLPGLHRNRSRMPEPPPGHPPCA